MTDGWQWDGSLFRGACAYYERGRLPYAPGFVETLTTVLGLDGSGRLLDVGCGPGIVTLALAPLFAEAVGLDPDQAMLDEAAKRTVRLEVADAHWLAARAEDLPAGLGEFRVAVFAQSFHWTDRDRVASTVLDMLKPGGAFVIMSRPRMSPGSRCRLSSLSLLRTRFRPTRRSASSFGGISARCAVRVRERPPTALRGAMRTPSSREPGSSASNGTPSRPGRRSSALLTTSSPRCIPCLTPRHICSATTCQTSSMTCEHSFSRHHPTAVSPSAFQRPSS